ncbi:MAG: alpha/beta hydrolase [Bacteriovoracaceae bacterium]|nr:alpha/beta hydrolase [Bacteriovoracaceae bacterium]
MKNVRQYGSKPIKAVLLHGGPGAPGYMAPVARELALDCGVLEPLQTKDSLSGQIAELKSHIDYSCEKPVALIGSSWGAVLALLYTAEYPSLVKKIILVGSAVFDKLSSNKVASTRQERMTSQVCAAFDDLAKQLEQAPAAKKNQLFEKLADLFFDCDTFNPITRDLEVIECQYLLNQKVWSEFVTLRDTPGHLQSMFKKISVPVVVIHGDFDPHGLEGIEPFLRSCIENIKFHILKKCGHYPWIERDALDNFYKLIKMNLYL